MSLGYPPLRQNQTNKIWRMNHEHTQRANLGLDIEADKILDFTDTHCDQAQENNGGELGMAVTLEMLSRLRLQSGTSNKKG